MSDMMSQMMGNYRGQPSADMPVTPGQAKEVAQQWLNINLPGIGVAEAVGVFDGGAVFVTVGVLDGVGVDLEFGGLPQGQDEFYFALPYQQMDIALWALNHSSNFREGALLAVNFGLDADVTGAVQMPEGVEMVMPGDNIKMSVELIAPIAMEEGLRFAIREGGRTVGAGVVSKVLE